MPPHRLPSPIAAPLTILLANLLACGSSSPPADDPASTSGASSTTGDPTPTSEPSSASTSSADETSPTDTTNPGDTSTLSGDTETSGTTSASTDDTTTADVDTDAESSSSGDTDPNPIECSLFDQDCPNDSKCAPWANDGGDTWNATRCVPIADDTAFFGDACTVEGDPLSGMDDCVQGAVCWDSPRFGLSCVALCFGPKDDPSCEDPSTVCTLDGVAPLCLPQ